MIYTQMTMEAMCLAYEAHHGQTDKGGVPYIFHPIHLAEQMEDEISATVALLHDVVEDTDWTLQQLAQRFPSEVIGALELLTHADGVPYEDYIQAIRQNPIAVRVKRADLRHNSDPTRITHASPEKMAGLRVRYAMALQMLRE